MAFLQVLVLNVVVAPALVLAGGVVDHFALAHTQCAGRLVAARLELLDQPLAEVGRENIGQNQDRRVIGRREGRRCIHGRDDLRRAVGDGCVAGPEHMLDALVGAADEADQLAARAEARGGLLVGVRQYEEIGLVGVREFLDQWLRVSADRKQMRARRHHSRRGGNHRLELGHRAGVLLCREQQHEDRPAPGLVRQVDDHAALVRQEEVRDSIAGLEKVAEFGCRHPHASGVMPQWAQ